MEEAAGDRHLDITFIWKKCISDGRCIASMPAKESIMYANPIMHANPIMI